MRRILRAASVGTTAVVLAGCYRGGAGDGAGGGESGGSDGGDASGDTTDGDAPAACAAADALDPGPVDLRRLTHREYAASVTDLLGIDATASVATFPDDVITGSFDNDAANQTISLLLGERYLGAAQDLAATVVADAALADALVGCDPAASGCIAEFVARFGRRAWRRPLEPALVDALVELAATQPDPWQGIALVVETVLMSPRFLFRVELGAVDPEHPERAKLDGYEVATRLSYFVWGTTPDDALLDAAAAGALDDAEGVAARANAMLADPRGRATFEEFGRQWFRADTIAGQLRDAASFPEFDATAVAAMEEELRLRLEDAMFGDDADLLALYDTRHGYVNDALAAIYGVDAPGSASLTPFEFAEGTDRGGLFTTAAFATASSRAAETSPVQRAVYVREVALCDPPPPPPPNIPSIEPGEGESVQDAFQRHIDQGGSCAACHLALDPIGFGLERYDSIGRLRTSYDDGSPVRTEGTIHVDDEEHAFGGGVELGSLVAGSAQAESCAVTHAWRWAMGRDEDDADACGRAVARDRFAASGHDFAELVLGVVASDTFRYRRIDP